MAQTGDQAKRDFFESRVRPVLVEHCYECHNSHETAESDLSLDHRQPFVEDRGDGALIVPGAPSKSRLLAIIRHEVSGLEMPEGRPPLDDQVINDIETWIRDGAIDPRNSPPSQSELQSALSWETAFAKRKQWWSFQPIRKPDPPAPDSLDSKNILARSHHPIDRFIAAEHAKHGLAAASLAEPTTLVRRLFYTLTGLPPTAKQAKHWSQKIADEQPSAYAKLVDELLSSQAFGEHWARHWMDWIRYSESHGSEGDPIIENAWMYRDYLIDALNDDISFDQLVREHIAGDLLNQPRLHPEKGTNQSILGAAHWRMVFHGFAPTDALEERVRFTDDQVNAFSKAFLGLTVSCARCHDHKFDAISQEDYYALYGILSSCRPSRHVIDVPESSREVRVQLRDLKSQIRVSVAKEWSSQIHEISNRLREKLSRIDQAKPLSNSSLLYPLWKMEEAISRGQPAEQAWPVAESLPEKSANDEDASFRWDFASDADYETWIASGTGLPDKPNSAGQFAIGADPATAIAGVYPSGVYSHSISDRDPARLTSTDVKLDDDRKVWVQVIGDGDSACRYVVQDYPRSGTVFPVKTLRPTWTWMEFDLSYWKGDSVHLELTTAKDAPLLTKPTERSWFGIRSAMILPADSQPPKDDIEFLRPILKDPSKPSTIEDALQIYRRAIGDTVKAWESEKMTDSKALLLDACLREGLLSRDDAGLPRSVALIERYRGLENKLKTPTRIPGIEDVPGRTQTLYQRGDHKKPDRIVFPRFLSAINPAPYESATPRLQLADDVLRDDNPLTRRVIVNRLWHHVFGAGIVTTPDNFGKLGAKPSHPELLDWLATQFTESNGSIKSMIRLMVTSKTWQLSSQIQNQHQAVDPENRLLARANVRRLGAESIRDAMLMVSGKLDPRRGGPPVDGTQPRRSVYVQVIRNRLDPFLRVFDFPEPFAPVGRRNATNVPAQSLIMMNNPFVGGLATQWAKNLDREQNLDDGGMGKSIDQVFWTAFSRPPSESESLAFATHWQQIIERQTLTQEAYERVKETIADLAERRESVLAPVREKLLSEQKSRNAESISDAENAATQEHLVADWDFTVDAKDHVGGADVELVGGAARSSEGLAFAPSGSPQYAITQPIAQRLEEKTLAAWVRLSNLQQRGGGVLTVQSPDGVVFDSIVFGEQQPGHWLAGSNNFARTQPFQGQSESETDEFVHLAIVYHADGRIEAFRNGELYGKSYQSRGPVKYRKNNWLVTLGLRHLPARPSRTFFGTIRSAQVFNKALDHRQIQSLANAGGQTVRDEDVFAVLGQNEKLFVQTTDRQLEEQRRLLKQLESKLVSTDDPTCASELTRSIFLMTEFIYLR